MMERKKPTYRILAFSILLLFIGIEATGQQQYYFEHTAVTRSCSSRVNYSGSSGSQTKTTETECFFLTSPRRTLNSSNSFTLSSKPDRIQWTLEYEREEEEDPSGCGGFCGFQTVQTVEADASRFLNDYASGTFVPIDRNPTASPDVSFWQ